MVKGAVQTSKTSRRPTRQMYLHDLQSSHAASQRRCAAVCSAPKSLGYMKGTHRPKLSPSSQRRAARGFCVPWDAPAEPERHAGRSAYWDPVPSKNGVPTPRKCFPAHPSGSLVVHVHKPRNPTYAGRKCLDLLILIFYRFKLN